MNDIEEMLASAESEYLSARNYAHACCKDAKVALVEEVVRQAKQQVAENMREDTCTYRVTDLLSKFSLDD